MWLTNNNNKKKIVIYDSCKRMTQAGFEPPLADDTSNEADTKPTEPPRLVYSVYLYDEAITFFRVKGQLHGHLPC